MENELLPFQYTERIYKKGETLFHEGTPSFGLYWINTGTVKVFTADPDGREVILRLASAGDIFGHGYIFGEKLHPNSAKAIEETHCQFLDGNHFNVLMQKDSELSMIILRKIGKELLMSQNRCVDLIKKNVRERLACHFYYMAQHHSTQDRPGTKIRIQLSREEIAAMIGTTSETAIRFISEFKEIGLIYEEDRFFHILDVSRLAAIGRLA
jgi:CRP-like cAMP-binding protein